MTQTNSKPKLFQYAVCPFCCKVKATLRYKGIDYETIEVHPLNKKEISFSKDYRKVPILVDQDGTQINDSTPIMRYLDQHYNGRQVFEQSGEAQQEEDQWIDWSDKVLVRALPPLIYRSIPEALEAFDYITQEGKFSWIQQRLVKYSGALVMKMVAKKTAKEQGITDAENHLKKCLSDWESALGERKFLGKDKPNGADLAIYGVLNSVENLSAFKWVKSNPKLKQWYEDLAQQLH
ncbi:MAG: glutathione S-transferase N-terminal domain-containing protein [Deltaproteobacteria bacterium]|nr:glutathione S-transferase N-terminal domain-containing protein [Deltaproteobacteria bacterium]